MNTIASATFPKSLWLRVRNKLFPPETLCSIIETGAFDIGTPGTGTGTSAEISTLNFAPAELVRNAIMDPLANSACASVSALNSYSSLAGFYTENEAQTLSPDGRKEPIINPEFWKKLDAQARVEDIVRDIMTTNDQLFIRPCKTSLDHQIRLFGTEVKHISEVLCEQGTRILWIGKFDLWNSCCNLNDPPENQEIERFEFLTDKGEQIFRCCMFLNKMKITMGNKFLGQVILYTHVGGDCSNWNIDAITVEDYCLDQVFRFEKCKRHFDVLFYPEQLKICALNTWWDYKEFTFLKPNQVIFGVPLPDDIGFRKNALLFTSSFYIYEKYYQKNKTCRFVMGGFICVSILSIIILIVLQHKNYFNVYK